MYNCWYENMLRGAMFKMYIILYAAMLYDIFIKTSQAGL